MVFLLSVAEKRFNGEIHSQFESMLKYGGFDEACVLTPAIIELFKYYFLFIGHRFE